MSASNRISAKHQPGARTVFLDYLLLRRSQLLILKIFEKEKEIMH